MVILHISDLHIGLLDHSTPGRLNAPIPRYTPHLKLFTGQWGHHHHAMKGLHEFYHKLVDDEGKVLVVMSGDATSVGKVGEFDNADAFLGSRLKGLGLGVATWGKHAVPGNHDHWPGSGWMFGRPTAGLAKYFPRANFPWTSVQRLTQTHRLRFIGINTDADVRSFGRSRAFARGAFHNQLVWLDNNLPQRPANEVRVLILHHSARFGAPAYADKLTMLPNSRKALDSALVNHGISVLMCGHTHAAEVQAFTATASSGLNRPVVECRCGTTTQRDRIPSSFRTPWGKFPKWKLEPNTLLVHRLYDLRGTVELSSQAYVLTSSGFNKYGKATRHTVGLPVGGKPATTP